ncbi:MAG: beta-lactamase family protein [Pirellulales bacterium]|nr:beta-lactamase family protein [Pirellulales bacterium]
MVPPPVPAGRNDWQNTFARLLGDVMPNALPPRGDRPSGPSRRAFLRISSGAAAALAIANVRAGIADTRASDEAPCDPPQNTPDTSRELPITGIERPELAGFDRAMLNFLREEKGVGAALAITKDGRLVYARGFGYADREARRVVEPHSLFRIASLSKAVTGAAILQLVQGDQLAMHARVREVLDICKIYDDRWRYITIAQLLDHTGGWDREQSYDAMFRAVEIAEALKVPPPAMPADVIRFMARQPLDFDPGSRNAYSNFGYSLLGRVIERLTGQRYDEYVRSEVLTPLGIRKMRLGATLPASRAEDEVCYYDGHDETGPAVLGNQIGAQVPWPYGAWCLEAMDAHGGWIASAIDMVRFGAAFDDPERCPILNGDSVRLMFTRPTGPAGYDADGGPKEAYYACGWNVRPVSDRGKFNAWHTGSLDGTSTLLVRRHDGLNWAVLFNVRDGASGKRMSLGADRWLHRVADEVTEWPDVDEFQST